MYLVELLAEELRQERLREAGAGRGEQEGQAFGRRFDGAGTKPVLFWSRISGLLRGMERLSRAMRIRLTGRVPLEAPCENCP